MRFVILCQEEPVFLGPVLRRVLEMRPQGVVAVVVAGTRSAGERRGTWRERWTSLRTFWLIFEPRGFFAALCVRLGARLAGAGGRRSIAGTARRLGIPVHELAHPKAADLVALLQTLAPDVVLNQSEILLTKDVLAVPRIGFINRHASLLPRFRGRMGAFRSHAAPDPSYGVTIHFVDEGIDTGPIVLQQEFADVDPRWTYPRVMHRVCATAPEMIWRALDLLASPDFRPLPNCLPDGAPPEKAFAFPSLAEALEYRRRLAMRRRAQGTAAGPRGS
jgi:folate-dependent phosphoribosylglycinamide formyltransferase PurN